MKYKGGISDCEKIKKELIMLSRNHRHEYVTTMFDYYAMPANTPNIDCCESDIVKRMHFIEDAINIDIGEPNCSFHFMVHEFEGILFSKPEAFKIIADDKAVDQIRCIRESFQTPEHINNSLETAPSKRLEKIIPRYAKIRNGTLLSASIGIDRLKEQCPHFRSWIQAIAVKAL